jgi:colanic acid biosynthesis glycosyl transferase WcaI
MHVMFMAQCYAPEDVSAAVLITELASDLARRGHRVTIVTGAPNYPYGRVFPGFRNRTYQVEWLDGVRVVRTWSYISSERSFWRRIMHYGTYSATAFYGGLLAEKPDVLVSYSPPLPLGLSAWMLSCLWRIPWVLQLEDLYPEAAMAAGMLRNRAAIVFFLAMERFLYQHATHISLISESFRHNLLGKGITPEKITVIPVWADPDLIRPLPKENPFRIQHGLVGKFVVMYAGNLGLTSCLEDMLYTAELLKEDPDIRFVFIGEGIKKPFLAEMSQKKELRNILFLPYQPREVFPQMLAAADLGLVTLNGRSSLTSLPSKTFNIMASGRPVLAITPHESELACVIREAACGCIVPPENPVLLAKGIRKLRQDAGLLTEMGRNGRSQIDTKFARAYCVDMYEHMLLRILQKDRKQVEKRVLIRENDHPQLYDYKREGM